MANTIKFDLDEWVAAQSQPWVKFNTAMSKIDQLMQITVVDLALTSPPGSPVEGDAYIPAATATGDWTGEEDNLAVYINGGWIFVTLVSGALIWNQNDSKYYNYDGTDIGELNIARV